MSVRHFLDIDGAVVLPTAQLALVDQAVADVVTRQAMGAVHGPAGLGKTFAVEQAPPPGHDAAGRGHAARRADR